METRKAFGLRVLSLGGIGSLVHNRNLHLTRALTKCPLCHTTTGFVRREDGSLCISLVHVMSHCGRAELVVARRTAHKVLMDMDDLEKGTSQRELFLLNQFKDMLSDDRHEQRPPVMFFLSLGVPIPPFPSARGDPSLPLPLPPHVTARRLWYGEHKEGAMKRMSKRLQAHVMQATAEHVVVSLTALQRRVWRLPGARPPAREKERLAEEQRRRDRERNKAQQERFVAYFRK